MVNIGILTFHWSHHYGALLQAYALLKLLKNAGFSADIINYKPLSSAVAFPTIKPGELGRKYKIMGFPVIKMLRNIAGEILYYLPSITEEFIKSRIFDEFREKLLCIRSEEINRIEELSYECSNFNVVVVGSDLVWHPDSLKYFYHAYLLPFKLKSTIKVSFSASIGVEPSSIPREIIILYKKFLTDFSFISVRERVHAEWLTKILGREVYYTLDPTLLVSKECFEQVARAYQQAPDDYILFYNLSTEILPFAEWLEKGLKLPVLIYRKPIIREWGIYGKFVRGKKSFYRAGPREFVDLLRRATMIFTDSYHGLTLSLVFEKPVVIALCGSSHRVKLGIRIEDLVKQLGLESIIIRTASDLKKVLRNEIDYRDVRSRLSELRKRSLELLREALTLVK